MYFDTPMIHPQQLFLQLEPEALDITDIESQHSDQQDDKTTKADEEKTDITTISSNFPQSSKIGGSVLVNPHLILTV